MMLGSTNMISMESKTMTNHGMVTTLVYALFASVAGFVYLSIAEGEFSCMPTICAIIQCLAFTLLAVQAWSGDVAGISAKGLLLDVIAIGLRLSSTTWLQGYVPNDPTGDYIYQLFDVFSLVVVLWLLYRILRVQRHQYEAEADAVPVTPLVVVSLVLAFLFHADLNDSPTFDSLWMCSLFVFSVAMVPQLWMMTHREGSLHALTGHFVAVMVVSRSISTSYMWEGHSEITCEPADSTKHIGTFNFCEAAPSHAGWAILAAHAVHLVLLMSIAYFFIKRAMKTSSKTGKVAPQPFLCCEQAGFIEV